jgi:hypothetical protein
MPVGLGQTARQSGFPKVEIAWGFKFLELGAQLMPVGAEAMGGGEKPPDGPWCRS